MPTPRRTLAQQANVILGQTEAYSVILLNALSAFDTTTDLAEIMQYECLQTTGGYEPQPYTYTLSTSTFNTTTGYQTAPDVPAEFSEAIAGSGYDHTHAALLYGDRPYANKAITSVDASTDVITLTNHLLVDGDRVIVRSTGTLPDGLMINDPAVADGAGYYAKVLDIDTFELYRDAGFTDQATFSDTGTGTLRLQCCNGYIYTYGTETGTIAAGQTNTIVVSYRLQ